eukprot:1086498_1
MKPEMRNEIELELKCGMDQSLATFKLVSRTFQVILSDIVRGGNGISISYGVNPKILIRNGSHGSFMMKIVKTESTTDLKPPENIRYIAGIGYTARVDPVICLHRRFILNNVLEFYVPNTNSIFITVWLRVNGTQYMLKSIHRNDMASSSMNTSSSGHNLSMETSSLRGISSFYALCGSFVTFTMRQSVINIAPSPPHNTHHPMDQRVQIHDTSARELIDQHVPPQNTNNRMVQNDPTVQVLCASAPLSNRPSNNTQYMNSIPVASNPFYPHAPPPLPVSFMQGQGVGVMPSASGFQINKQQYMATSSMNPMMFTMNPMHHHQAPHPMYRPSAPSQYIPVKTEQIANIPVAIDTLKELDRMCKEGRFAPRFAQCKERLEEPLFPLEPLYRPSKKKPRLNPYKQ